MRIKLCRSSAYFSLRILTDFGFEKVFAIRGTSKYPFLLNGNISNPDTNRGIKKAKSTQAVGLQTNPKVPAACLL